VVSILVWLGWVIDLPWFEFKSRKFRWFYPIICVMWRNTFGCETWCRGPGWSNTGQVLGGQTIEWWGDAVCSLHRAQGDEEHEFLGSASKPRSAKPKWTGSQFYASKWQIRLGDLATKSPLRFLSLCLKIKWVTVYQLRHKINGRMKMAQDTSQDLATCFVK
jgi:hypothetical protein